MHPRGWGTPGCPLGVKRAIVPPSIQALDVFYRRRLHFSRHRFTPSRGQRGLTWPARPVEQLRGRKRTSPLLLRTPTRQLFQQCRVFSANLYFIATYVCRLHTRCRGGVANLAEPVRGGGVSFGDHRLQHGQELSTSTHSWYLKLLPPPETTNAWHRNVFRATSRQQAADRASLIGGCRFSAG